MPGVNTPREVISTYGAADVIAYSEVMQYPLMEAAFEVEDMLRSRFISSYQQMARRTDVTEMIVARVCEIDREANLADHEVTVHNPHGRFFPLAEVVSNGLTNPRIEIHKVTDEESLIKPRVSGTVLRLTLGECHEEYSRDSQVCLGLNLNAEITLNGRRIPGYWFIPLGGNHITVTPPVSLN